MRRLLIVFSLFFALQANAQLVIQDFPLLTQAPGQCLATSAFLIQSHFASVPGAPTVLYVDGDMQISRDDVEQWTDGLALPHRPSLRTLAERLKTLRVPDGHQAFDLALMSKAVSGRSWNSVRQRRSRLTAIDEYLDQGRPVVIHLDRPWRVAGHYITLIGYEDLPDGRVYHYADTSDAGAGIKTTPASDLSATHYWYRGSSGLPARWNGRYLAVWAR